MKICSGYHFLIVIQIAVSIIFCIVIGLFLTETLQKSPNEKVDLIDSIREIIPEYKGNILALQAASSVSQFAYR